MNNSNKYDIFISYSRNDFEEVNDFVNMLMQRIPSIKIWFDITGIESGDEFESKIISAIDNSEVIIFALSDNSIESTWAKDEVMYAKNTGKKIVPLLLNKQKMHGWFLFKFGRVDCINIAKPIEVDKLIRNISAWSRESSAADVKQNNTTNTHSYTHTSSTLSKTIQTETNLPNERLNKQNYLTRNLTIKIKKSISLSKIVAVGILGAIFLFLIAITNSIIIGAISTVAVALLYTRK